MPRTCKLKPLQLQAGTIMRIGELSRQTDTSVAAIRYYEKIGLLPSAFRIGGKQRIYQPSDAERVGFIRRCRKLGFSLSDIAAFARVARNEASQGSCAAIVRKRLATVQSEIEQLRATERRLLDLISDRPQSTCPRLEKIR